MVIVKPFLGRTNINLTFLFPRLDCGIIISDFEKIAFFDSMAIFGDFSPPQKAFFAARTLLKIPLLFEKKVKNEKFLWNFLEKLLSYPEIYQWVSLKRPPPSKRTFFRIPLCLVTGITRPQNTPTPLLNDPNLFEGGGYS